MTDQISCSIGTTDPLAKLGLEIRLNDQVIFLTSHVIGPIDFKYDMPNVDGNYRLEFVMKNKTTAHTQIDANGNIVKDACLTISNVAFDEIELKQIFIDRAIYTHNFNGTQDEVNDKFYGAMGCNGSVKLEFSTPVYSWLLENM